MTSDDDWRKAIACLEGLDGLRGYSHDELHMVADMLACARESGLVWGAAIVAMFQAIRSRPVTCNACDGKGYRMSASFSNPRNKVPRDCGVCWGKGRVAPIYDNETHA